MRPGRSDGITIVVGASRRAEGTDLDVETQTVTVTVVFVAVDDDDDDDDDDVVVVVVADVVIAIGNAIASWAEVPRSRWKERQREAQSAELRLKWTYFEREQGRQQDGAAGTGSVVGDRQQ